MKKQQNKFQNPITREEKLWRSGENDESFFERFVFEKTIDGLIWSNT